MVEDARDAHFAFDDNEPVFRGGFDGDTGIRVQREICIEDGIGDDVADFVRVTFGHCFRGEESCHGWVPFIGLTAGLLGPGMPIDGW